MAGWDDIIKELGETISLVDQIRKKYLGELSDYTERNTINVGTIFNNKKYAVADSSANIQQELREEFRWKN